MGVVLRKEKLFLLGILDNFQKLTSKCPLFTENSYNFVLLSMDLYHCEHYVLWQFNLKNIVSGSA